MKGRISKLFFKVIWEMSDEQTRRKFYVSEIIEVWTNFYDVPDELY